MCSTFLIILRAFIIIVIINFISQVNLQQIKQDFNVKTKDLYPDNINVNDINQRYNNNNNTNVDVLDPTFYPGNKCYRQCNTDTKSMICYFKFVMEQYHAMGPACGNCSQGVIADCFNLHCITVDGFERGVLSINRMIPGPAIHICVNDLIVVDVVNKMGGESTTLHWHGLHQKATPFMDGVPFITQCPIHFSTTFRYKFTATEYGTQFYHSHSGHHKVDGHYGVLIVRQPTIKNPNAYTYQFDLKSHTIIASDWMHTISTMFVPGLPTHSPGITPDSLLINGRGIFTKRKPIIKTPLEVFRINERGCYRFRFINSASHTCPLQIQIEDHEMLVIATDSNLIEPIKVNTIISTSGERYDFVLCGKEEKDNVTGEMRLVSRDYWIRLRAIGSCIERKLEQFAILSYGQNDKNIINLSVPNRSYPKYEQSYDLGMILNHPNSTCFVPDDNFTCIAELKSINPDLNLLNADAKCKYIVTFDDYLIDKKTIFDVNQYEHFMNTRKETILMGAMNNISFIFPSIPVLTQTNEINNMTFCDETNKPKHCDNRKICCCTQRIKIPRNCIVEITIVDTTAAIRNLNHPIHLHGYEPYIIDFGQHPDKIPMTRQLAIELIAKKESQKFQLKNSTNKNESPIKKDTISIPSRGYTTIKFKADNPGFWLFHCHFEWHMEIGMALVFQVGELDDIIQPSIDFPQCRNFQPKLKLNDLF